MAAAPKECLVSVGVVAHAVVWSVADGTFRPLSERTAPFVAWAGDATVAFATLMWIPASTAMGRQFWMGGAWLSITRLGDRRANVPFAGIGPPVKTVSGGGDKGRGLFGQFLRQFGYVRGCCAVHYVPRCQPVVRCQAVVDGGYPGLEGVVGFPGVSAAVRIRLGSAG